MKVRKRAKCPYCGRTVSLTSTGKVHAHLVKGTGKRCGGSGRQL